jgi:hypothetical protein
MLFEPRENLACQGEDEKKKENNREPVVVKYFFHVVPALHTVLKNYSTPVQPRTSLEMGHKKTPHCSGALNS